MPNKCTVYRKCFDLALCVSQPLGYDRQTTTELLKTAAGPFSGDCDGIDDFRWDRSKIK